MNDCEWNFCQHLFHVPSIRTRSGTYIKKDSCAIWVRIQRKCLYNAKRDKQTNAKIRTRLCILISAYQRDNCNARMYLYLYIGIYEATGVIRYKKFAYHKLHWGLEEKNHWISRDTIKYINRDASLLFTSLITLIF